MALVISRQPNETVIINGSIRITVLSPYRVKLAIDAPKEVPVDRLEIYERKQRERDAA